ncbi:MAG: tRNA 2-thiouridine(34) synthase MnmA [Bacteroidaceae bacterium]|nr:tRNA 2-thiouridine(34) synthase MnmA [Bacteroidaceae bacterium]
MRELHGKKVAALLSGGVDSSVAVALLVEQGIQPDLWYIQIGPERDTTDFTCTIEEDLEMARAVAAKYRLSLQVIDLHKDYWEHVVDYTISQVRQGLTPNPDVMCNRLIKFGVFNERVGHDYDIIATGHYAQTEEDEQGRTWLCTSPDPVKDQTDFLAQLQPWQLRKACFPIGHLPKSEVRAIAEREHLSAAHRKDSQGICFLGKIDYNDYIRKYLGEQPGQVIDRETGRVLGLHRGLWFHTIGQRKGLGFGGGPWYVIEKDMKRNILWVAHGYDPIAAYSDQFHVVEPHWLTTDPFTDAAFTDPTTPAATPQLSVTLKIRHTPDFCPATISLQPDGRLAIQTERPLQGVAPGQFCVIYDPQRHRCFGSGEIRL